MNITPNVPFFDVYSEYNSDLRDSSEKPDEIHLSEARIIPPYLQAILILAAVGGLGQIFSLYVLTIVKVLYYAVIESFKAFFPCGWLPRKSVKSEVVLITGTGNGLGRLMAIEFAKLGARIVLWDVNEAGNAETKRIIESAGGEAHAYTIDLSQRDQIYAMADKTCAEVGDVNILINNAGIVSGKKIFECPDELMVKTMAVNSQALFWTTKAFLPKMLAKNHGHVVTIASMAGHSGVCGLVDYCASKHAAVGFSRALRSEIRTLGKDVPVTTVNPFYINTGMFSGVKTFSPIMFPLMEPSYVVDRIMEAILTNTDAIYLPGSASLYLMLKGLFPNKSMEVIEDFFGVNKNMDEFVGRGNGITKMDIKSIDKHNSVRSNGVSNNNNNNILSVKN